MRVTETSSLLARETGESRLSTVHSVSTDRRTPDRAPKGASVQELLAGNDEQRARAVSSERSDRSSARFSNRPSVHRHGRYSKEHREVRSPRHIHAAANRSTSVERSVANRSKRSTERQSRRGHCVGVNAAATADIWARDPDVHSVDAPPLFERGSETSKASARCGGLKIANRVA